MIPGESKLHNHRRKIAILHTKLRQPLLPLVTIEEVERVERDDSAIRVDDVDAALLHAPHIEVMRVQELHDDHAEDVVVMHVRRDLHLREAAEELLEGSG